MRDLRNLLPALLCVLGLAGLGSCGQATAPPAKSTSSREDLLVELGSLKERVAQLEERNREAAKRAAALARQLEAAQKERAALFEQVQALNAGPDQAKFGDAQVLSLLNSSDYELVRAGVSIVRRRPSKSRLQALAALARSPLRDLSARYAAMDALGVVPLPLARETMAALLENPNEQIVARAARALGNTRNVKYFPMLLQALSHVKTVDTPRKYSEARRSLVQALAMLGDKRATPVLVETLQSPNSYIQRAALSALRAFRDPSAAPALLKMLKSLKPPTSRNSTYLYNELIQALAALGDPRAGPAFIHLLDAPNVRLRQTVAKYLPQVCGAESVGPLRTALRREWGGMQFTKSKKNTMLEAIIRALGATRQPGAAKVLLEALSEGMTGGAGAEAALVLPQLCEPSLARELVRAYPKIADRAAKTALHKILSSGEYPVRYDAAAKLFRMGKATPDAKPAAAKAAQTHSRKAKRKGDQF